MVCSTKQCVCKNEKEIENEKKVEDDIWCDSDVIPNNDIIRHHYKQGYLDGLTSNKENSLQCGFNLAYPIGAELGIKVGKILATVKCNNEESFDNAKNQLNIKNILNNKYFDNDLNLLNDSHELINKWESKPNAIEQ
ncbi:unnamed protein product [Candida verbasci]|uniref:Essential protein Yae1 N-terminal domain-containing protein n=1 Tax=Candida verbasci TaxID=1227364 RepID=A0A9W4U1K9_9ASCO|nr:unnamed protein product [Candida verbasci]